MSEPQVEILEEGPREGFQAEPAGIAAASKVELIEQLAETGLRDVEGRHLVRAASPPPCSAAAREPIRWLRGCAMRPGNKDLSAR